MSTGELIQKINDNTTLVDNGRRKNPNWQETAKLK